MDNKNKSFWDFWDWDVLPFLKAAGAAGAKGFLKTVTGAIIHILDGIAKPAESLTVSFSPIQTGSGDPSPDNIRPIYGRTSLDVVRTGSNFISSDRTLGEPSDTTGTPVKRLFDFGTYVKGVNQSNYYYPSYIQSISLENNVLKFTSSNQNYGIGFPLKVYSGKWYCTATNNCRDAFIAFYKEDGTYISNSRLFSSAGWTTPSDNGFCLAVFMGYANTEATVQNLMLSPTANEPYTPYTGETKTITFPSTIYGGTAEVVGGNGESTFGYVELDGSDDEGWILYQAGKFYIENVTTDAKVVGEGQEYLSNIYKFAGKGDTASNLVTTDKRFYGQTYYGRIWVYDSSYSTLDAFKTALAQTPMQIAYPYTTAVPFSTTPTQIDILQGENVIWSSGDNNELTYYGSTPPTP